MCRHCYSWSRILSSQERKLKSPPLLSREQQKNYQQELRELAEESRDLVLALKRSNS